MSEMVAVGDVIADKYRVDSIVGRGGMGMVVAATHLELRKVRAIKLMLPEANAVPMAAERFLREARAACELTSEHVAHVFDVGRLASGAPFMVMEHLDGRDLAAELARRGALPVEEAVLYAIQVCEALAEAHARGIVHRDLKPGNLFLTSANDGSPRVKVLDFGISKVLDTDAESLNGAMTASGAILGSPLYMSPEQIRGDRDLDARSDIWSLGVILYELLTGRIPFDCDNAVKSLYMVLERMPPPPSQIEASVPPALDALILQCLEKRPCDRYPNVAALARGLLLFVPVSVAPLVERIVRVAAVSGSRASLPSLHERVGEGCAPRDAGPAGRERVPSSATLAASPAVRTLAAAPVAPRAPSPPAFVPTAPALAVARRASSTLPFAPPTPTRGSAIADYVMTAFPVEAPAAPRPRAALPIAAALMALALVAGAAVAALGGVSAPAFLASAPSATLPYAYAAPPWPSSSVVSAVLPVASSEQAAQPAASAAPAASARDKLSPGARPERRSPGRPRLTSSVPPRY